MTVGTAVTGYSYALEGLIHVMWVLLPDALDPVFGPSFPKYNMNWLIPLVWGGFFAGLLLMILKRFGFVTGSIISAIRGVHDQGLIPFRNLLPMLFVSLITITAGGSAGPEASVMVMVRREDFW